MQCRTFITSLLLLFVSEICSAQVFSQITPSVCPPTSAGLFTTGQQYLGANNGVLQDSWSMLVRWQGNPTVGNTSWYQHPMSYNGGMYTNYTPPTPYTSWQRGYTPESGPAGTPGVQLHCFDAGMLINTFATPHAGAAVLGGGFNDMYGYAWSPANQPLAFETVRNGVNESAELVIQSDLEVPVLNGWSGVEQPDGSYTYTPVTNLANYETYGTANLSFFVYLADTSHTSLHPIGILAAPFDNGYCGNCSCEIEGSEAFVGWDYPAGAWFGSADLCTTDVTTVRYTGSTTRTSPFTGEQFFRIHITPQNLVNLVNRINAQQCQAGMTGSCNCTPGSTCPQNGYSTNPNVYKIQYVGIIAESSLCDEHGSNVHCSTDLRDPSEPGYNPGQDSNLSFALHATGVSAFWYTSN